MDFIRFNWRYWIAALIFLCLSLSLMIFPECFVNFIGQWINILSFGFAALAIIIISAGGSIFFIKKYPKLRGIKELAIYRVVNHVVPLLLGYVFAHLIHEPIIYEKELAQGIMTSSSILLALSGVFLSIGRFSAKKKSIEEIMAGVFKTYLILSVVVGFITILLVLFWYSKASFSYLWWAIFTFGIQLGYILVFLLFPKYYLK
jgi:hypothetical protein